MSERSNVICFPTCKSISGRCWYGGRGFKTLDDLRATMSDRDWRRAVQWETRNAAWLMSKQRQRGDGNMQSGGGGSAA
jgi:hypothetical protein